jgi:hypothetical protein
MRHPLTRIIPGFTILENRTGYPGTKCTGVHAAQTGSYTSVHPQRLTIRAVFDLYEKYILTHYPTDARGGFFLIRVGQLSDRWNAALYCAKSALLYPNIEKKSSFIEILGRQMLLMG